VAQSPEGLEAPNQIEVGAMPGTTARCLVGMR
jgi:hypothetical protein